MNKEMCEKVELHAKIHHNHSKMVQNVLNFDEKINVSKWGKEVKIHPKMTLKDIKDPENWVFDNFFFSE